MHPRTQRLTATLLTVAALVAQGAPAQRTAQRPAPLPESAAAIARAWFKTEDALAFLRASGTPGQAHPRSDATAWQEFARAHARAAGQLLRHGLWSDEAEVARGAALRLTYEHLDLADSRRYLEVARRDIFTATPWFDFSDFRYVLDSESIDALLADEPPRGRDVYYILSQLHRNLRAHHVPLVLRMMHCEQSIIRHDAFSTLRTLGDYTDQYRDEIARAIVAWEPHKVVGPDDERPRNYTPRPVALEPKPDGLSAELHAAVQRIFATPAPDQDNLLHDGTKEIYSMRRWARRHVCQTEVGPSDRALLLWLAARDGDAIAQQTAARAMRWLNDPDTDAALRRLAGPALTADAADATGATSDDVIRDALVSLALRRDRRALAILRLAARADAATCAAWLEADPDAAALVVRAICADRGHEAPAWIDRLQEAIEDETYHGYSGARALGPALEAAAIRSEGIDTWRLDALIAHIPGCRTQRMAEKLLDRIDLGLLADLQSLPWLEVADPAGLRAALSAALAFDQPHVRRRAVELLATLGSAEHADAILAFDDGPGPIPPFVLARTPTTDVRERLVARARQALAAADPDAGLTAALIESLFAIAAFDGIPEAAARGWAGAVLSVEGEAGARPAWWDTVAQAVFEGRPVDALVAFLEAESDAPVLFANIGLVRDPRIRVILRDRAHRAEFGQRNRAVSELALAGDPEARLEVAEVLRAGFHGWLDEADPRSMSDGFSVAGLAAWAEELETNCCRAVAASGVFEPALGIDFSDNGTGHFVLPVDRARRVVARARAGQIGHSHIAGHSVILGP